LRRNNSQAVDISTLHQDALLTTREVAATFRISAGRLRNLRVERRGPRAIRLGRDVKHRLKDVLDWLEAHAERDDLSEDGN